MSLQQIVERRLIVRQRLARSPCEGNLGFHAQNPGPGVRRRVCIKTLRLPSKYRRIGHHRQIVRVNT